MKHLIVALPLLALISGCSSVACHDNFNYGDMEHGIYRGVRHDVNSIGKASGEQVMGVPYYVIDTPFSLAGDTLFLPLDLISLMAKPKTEKPEKAKVSTPSAPRTAPNPQSTQPPP